MNFRTFGNKENPSVMLLHGGGLSWWSLQKHIDALKDEYYVIAATIDGHGEEASTTFTTIQSCADKIEAYIGLSPYNELYAVCGLSIGAQIAVELMSRKKDIVKKAVIESALVYPMKYTAMMIKPMYNLSFGLIKKEWFAKYQAKALFVPDDMFNQYFEDSKLMSRESLINMSMSNSTYTLPQGLAQSEAEAIIFVGEKELPIMKKSAKLLKDTIAHSRLSTVKNAGHGELSLKYTHKYIELVSEFLKNGLGGSKQ